MKKSETIGKKILVTFIGANPARKTQYASFTETDENGVYRLKNDNQKVSLIEEYGYPFLAKITEEDFDEIIFIGTSGSKWEALQSYLHRKNEENKWPEQKEETVSDEQNNKEILEFLNNYASIIKKGNRKPITDQELGDIKSAIIKAATTDEEKKERQQTAAEKHNQFISSNMCNDDKKKTYEDDVAEQIYQFLQTKRASAGKPNVNVIIISEGRTETENKDNVNRIKSVISSKNISEITLDVTNGFRSHPMYVFSILNNISAICDSEIPIHIYYGMFDAKVEAKGEAEDCFVAASGYTGIAPMVNLQEITKLDGWTRAMNEFSSNGSVIQILGLLEGSKDKGVELYKKALETFSLAVNSNNLKMFEDAIQQIHELKKQNQEIKCFDSEYADKCLEMVVSKIWDKFNWGEYGEKTKYASYMFSLAEWYLEQNRLGDSVRTFQEAVITYVMEAYPKEIYRLLDKKMLNWKDMTADDEEESILNNRFSSAVRQVLRNAIFDDTQTILEEQQEEYQEWMAWLKEYNYMKEHIHNPQELLYVANNQSEEVDSKTAKIMILDFAEKMKSERDGNDKEKKQLYKRICYLLDINDYDVFISYRRSYHMDNGRELNDGVLLVTAIKDYLEKKGLKVFVDKERMKGKEGAFNQHLRNGLLNSKICLVILGKNAYSRPVYAEDTSGKKQRDVFYDEIITAVENQRKIAVLCMKDFYSETDTIIMGTEVENHTPLTDILTCDNWIKKRILSADYGAGVEQQAALMDVEKNRQRIGSTFTDRWEYENIVALRECVYDELCKMLKIEKGKDDE